MKINNQLNSSKKLNDIEQTIESNTITNNINTNNNNNTNNNTYDNISSAFALIGDIRPTLATTCINTTRIDIRRARSFRDLSVNQSQQVYRLNDLILNEKLGEGFFAIVKKITHRRTGQVMVLKELKIDTIQTTQQNDIQCVTSEANQAHKSFLKEAQILRNLNHPNIIKFLGVLFTKDRRLNLILEYVNGGTLKDIIHNLSNSLPWKLRVAYAKDIAAGMEYLHSLNIIHRDLKSDNCLVRENGSVVVADFGLSRIVEDDTITNLTMVETVEPTRPPAQSLFINTQISPSSCEEGSSIIAAAKRKLKRRVDRKQRYAVVGNSFSMAPEMLKHEIYDERVDIFSFGIICCEVIKNKTI
jgi:serine/threonine protein kinase